MKNLFDVLSINPKDEHFQTLLTGRSFRVERIVSHGHASPVDFWFDQPQDEWVLVLQGEATLRFDDEPDPIVMGPGDCLHLPAHRRHRVDWTTDEGPTIWLAIHFDA